MHAASFAAFLSSVGLKAARVRVGGTGLGLLSPHDRVSRLQKVARVLREVGFRTPVGNLYPFASSRFRKEMKRPDFSDFRLIDEA